jgi:hypothetical protein
VKEDRHETNHEMPPLGETPPKKRNSRLILVVIVVALIGAGFGTGALLASTRFHSAESLWQQEKTQLQTKIADQVVDISAGKSRELLWQLGDGMSTVYVDLSDKNFGLAHDAMSAMTVILTKAASEADPKMRAQLQEFQPLMADIDRSAMTFSPEAKVKAREARALLQKLIGVSAL